MKPTQEQVIAWARKAGVINCDCCLPFWPEEDQVNWEIFFERLATIAYEAGRADENEACARLCDSSIHDTYIEGYTGAKHSGRRECAAAIRARREQ